MGAGDSGVSGQVRNRPSPEMAWTDADLKAYLAKAFPPTRRPTISELEAILEQEEYVPLEILPNGEIRALGGSEAAERQGEKPLTMREDLGGEYGRMAA